MLKVKYYHYFLLTARVLLAYMLLSYGWAKLTGGQFGVDDKTVNMPLKEIDLFRLSWHLADKQPFKAFIGVSQVVTGLLLLVNRMVVIGAFISIPIWLNILIWDMTFMGLITPFTLRLSGYIFLTLLILYQHKTKIISALRLLTAHDIPVNYPVWMYAILPIIVILIELLIAMPSAVLYYLRLIGK